MKVESFRTQKEVIKAQYSAAEAQVRIGEAATGIGADMADIGLAVERAKDKTQQLQARADAVSELTAAGALDDFTAQGDNIDRELAKIGQSGQVEDELEQLKAELGSGAAAEIEAPEETAAAELPAAEGAEPESHEGAPASEPSEA